MVDQLGIRRRAGRRPRRGPGRTGDVIAEDRRHASSDARSVLAIVHARYDRELTRAATGDPAERARALAEARRLVNVAVALRERVTEQHVDRITPVPAERPEPDLHDP